jgi:hypothetical protein
MLRIIWKFLIDYYWGIAVGALITSILGLFFTILNSLEIMGWSFEWTAEQQKVANEVFDVVGKVSLITAIISSIPIVVRRLRTGQWF